VAAGLARYFRIDPILPRIIFVILLLASGAGALVYFLMWILVPVMPSRSGASNAHVLDGSHHRTAIRQLFRDPENKKLAGVAAGLGHYFNVDPLVFRLLFVIFAFISGIGLVAYLAIWVLVPEAQTTADKLKMKGQPVNVENIERNIREEAERLGEKLNQMGAEAGHGLGNAGRQAGPLVGSFLKAIARIVAIVVGIIFFIIGTALLFVLTAFISGWEGFTFFEDVEIPLGLSDVLGLFVTDPAMAQLTGISLGAFILIPLVMLVYVSIKLIVGGRFRLPGIGNIAGVLWSLSIIGLGYSAYHLGSDFKETAKTELVNSEIVNNKKLIVVAKDVRPTKSEPIFVFDGHRYLLENSGGKESLLIMPHFYIETIQSGKTPFLKVEAVAKGKDEDLARERSSKLSFPVEYRNDTLFLPVWFSIDAAEGLRAQRINLRISLPDSTYVEFDRALDNFFFNNPRSYWQSREFAGRNYLLTANGLESIY
jgi:phage shock protein PspC (stress-responsive transcriptional regulator)